VSSSPEISEKCLNEIGICFMFAPLYHGATARVAGIRRQLGVQTTFNLLGPLTNPARAPRQIIGVWDRDLIEPLAQTLALLGTERAWIVHGADGLDEVTISGSTFIAEAIQGQVRTFEVGPDDFGLGRSDFRRAAERGAGLGRDKCGCGLACWRFWRKSTRRGPDCGQQHRQRCSFG
jgi:anthranilate phosphoribosyltransferase